VGWVGSPGVGVSVTVGNVGWFPLGPREVYVPARRYSHRYFERVNVSNTVIVNRTYITNVYNNRGGNLSYRNRLVPGAVTTVSPTAFTSAGRVGDHRVRIDDREMGRMRTAAVPPPIAPARESRYGSTTRGNLRPPPRTVVERPVVVNRSPPASSERFTRRVADQVAVSRAPQPTQMPPPQGRDLSNREDAGRRNGGGVGTHHRTDRPQRDVTSSPKTPPGVGYAQSQRAEVGGPQVQRPQVDERQGDRPPREQLERRERERHQDPDRQARQAEVHQRQLQQQQQQQQERRQAEYDRRGQEQREVQPRERVTERPRSEPPRAERAHEDRSNRAQRAEEARHQKRQDDSHPQKN
jgi:hypothetical protein